MLSTSTVTIPIPEGPAPIAVLEAPGTIPRCGTLKLVARNSLYGGGRALSYAWNVSTNDEMLNGMIAMNTESSIEIPIEAFNDSGPYIFTVTVTNFLGLQDSTKISLCKSLLETVIVTIYGSHNRSYPVDSDNIVIEATAEVLSCSAVDGSTLEYSWTVTNSDGAMVTLESTATRYFELWIPPLTLQPGMVYDVQLSVQYTGQPSTAGSAGIQVTGLHPEIIAAIQTGRKSSVRVTQPIYLDTSPSRGLLADQTYSYQWQCDICGSSDDVVTTSSSSSLTLQANTLPIGSYLFTVTITHPSTGTSSTASTILEVIEAVTGRSEVTPLVKFSLPSKWNTLSANDKTIVSASVYVPSAATVEWSTVEVRSVGRYL